MPAGPQTIGCSCWSTLPQSLFLDLAVSGMAFWSTVHYGRQVNSELLLQGRPCRLDAHPHPQQRPECRCRQRTRSPCRLHSARDRRQANEWRVSTAGWSAVHSKACKLQTANVFLARCRGLAIRSFQGDLVCHHLDTGGSTDLQVTVGGNLALSGQSRECFGSYLWSL